MDKICSILVNSCDAYQDTWLPFFTLFKKFWPDCEYPIYLNSESKRLYCNDLDIITINHSIEQARSDRVIHSLKMIHSKFVILLLDDFFFDDFVDQSKISECIRWMQKNRHIAVFTFASSLWNDIDDRKYDGFELRPVKGEYRFNMQAALWRRTTLLKILKHGESPWDAEHMGTFRARVLMPKILFYTAKKNEKKVISYEYGGAIHQGKWTIGTPQLLKRHNISGIEFGIRGFDPTPTEIWARLRTDERDENIIKKNIKIRIGEYFVATGVVKKNSSLHKRKYGR